VEDLASLDDFTEYDEPLERRADQHVFWFSAVYLGLVIGGILLLEGAPIAFALGEASLAGGIFGLAAVITKRWGKRKRTRRALARLFTNQSPIVPAPPAGATHRLFCSLFIDKKTSLPGALYVTADGLVFRSHLFIQTWPDWLLRRSPPRAPDIVLSPPRELRLDMGWIKHSRLRRWLIGYEIPVLLVQNSDAAWAFRVPKTFEVLTRLQTVLDRVRFPEGPAA